jgi:hypothetical protein
MSNIIALIIAVGLAGDAAAETARGMLRIRGTRPFERDEQTSVQITAKQIDPMEFAVCANISKMKIWKYF